MSTQDTSGYIGLFLKTAKDHVEEMKKAVTIVLQENNSDPVEVIFRNAHSLKGSSAVMGFDDISKSSSLLCDLARNRQDFINSIEEGKRLIELIENQIQDLDGKNVTRGF